MTPHRMSLIQLVSFNLKSQANILWMINLFGLHIWAETMFLLKKWKLLFAHPVPT